MRKGDAIETPESLGQALRESRLQAGATIDQVATGANVSRGHISRIEHGHHVPRRELLDDIARVLTENPDEQRALAQSRDTEDLVMRLGFDRAAARLAVLLGRGELDPDTLKASLEQLPPETLVALTKALEQAGSQDSLLSDSPG